MDAATFSTALFTELCHDLGISGIDPEHRFDPLKHVTFSDELDGLGPKSSLLRSVFKKSEVESASDADAVTLDLFLQANQKCGSWSPPVIDDLAVGYSISYAKSFIADWLEPKCGTELLLTMSSIEKEARFGPGRSIGLGDKPSLYYFKVGDSAMTAASDFVRSWYDLSVTFNPLCEAAEMARKARCGPIKLVSSGNLTLVPKSYTNKRVVVTEPSVNTYFQLGAGRVLEHALKRGTGIDLSLQPGYNSQLAKLGSEKGNYATIDLKQCSDYIAIGLVKYLVPKRAFNWLRILRTPKVALPSGKKLPVWMMSTMGNGYTFPLQTLLLAGLVLGVYRTLDIPIEHPKRGIGNYGVFGDDIVVRSEAFNLLCRVISTLGLIVNEDKSFASGPFRESCGSDWKSGHNIRGVYLKRYTSLQDFYSALNRLAVWSARHMIELPRTLDFIGRCIGQENLHVVPPDEGLDSGVVYPVPPEPENRNGMWRYRLYVPRLNSFSVEPWEYYSQAETVDKKRATVKKWLAGLNTVMDGSINEPALFKALLCGVLRRGTLVFRKKGEVLKYRLVYRETPRWGFSSNTLVADMSPVQVDRWLRSINRVLDWNR